MELVLGLDTSDDVRNCAVAVGSLAERVVRFVANGDEDGVDVQFEGARLGGEIDSGSWADVLALTTILPPHGQAA